MSAADPEPAAVPSKRRWYQFSLRTLLLLPLVLALVLSAIYSWPYFERRYIVTRLRDYADRDLRQLPKQEAELVDHWIEALVGPKPLDFDLQLPQILSDNRLLHTTDDQSFGKCIYVVRISPPHKWPTTPYSFGIVHIHAIDKWGRQIGATSLNTEWGSTMPAVTLEDSTDGLLRLVVVSRSEIDDKMYGGIYYISKEDTQLLREESLEGKCNMSRGCLASREYASDSYKWKELLQSGDRLQQLRGLAILFSIRNEAKPQNGVNSEDTLRRLEKLATSPDPWISEEAKLALEEAKKK
jgi:hypothetical protein